MYLARFLLQYDERSAYWINSATASLPSSWSASQRQAALREALGAFGSSLSYRLAPLAATGEAGAATLFDGLSAAYGHRGHEDDEVASQLTLLFSLLAPAMQPIEAMHVARPPVGGSGSGSGSGDGNGNSGTDRGGGTDGGTGAGGVAGGTVGVSAVGGDSTGDCATPAELAAALARDVDALLPAQVVHAEWDAQQAGYVLPRPLAEALLARTEEGASSAFGALARAPLSAERALGVSTYGLFALAGGCGCALTHLAVVPLDVVKTRLQTRPGQYAGFRDALTTIRREEGVHMLFQGAQATGLGYFAYGVSVYPGYELAKRSLFAFAGPTATLEWRVPLVLLAGALATVVTCFLITPFEAVRVRMVECPGYAPDLAAALRRYASEGSVLSLYDGFIPLLVRQVLFGMVKFLIFDTCADVILTALPRSVADGQPALALGVSLLSGAIAGVGAAVVSQPADVVLSKVTQGDGSKTTVGQLPGHVNQIALLQQAAGSIVRKYGVPGLYLGLPSRCLWSGAIIAGQFFLYDVFKGALHVTAADLTLFYDALGASAAGAQLGL